MKKIIVGLGNPGGEHAESRHNVGFIFLDQLAEINGLRWKENKRFKALVTTLGDAFLIKPQTYMNESGESVSKTASFYKLAPASLFVIHDDVDIKLFEYKIQFGKESAGHRGVRNIMEKLGTKDFWRVRIGIGRPEVGSYDVEDYVLSRFSEEDLLKIKELGNSIFRQISQS